MYGFMFTVHTPLFSVYLAKPKILTYQRFDSKDLYIFVIAISQLSTNSMQPSMQGLWISSKTNTDNQSVKIKRFVPIGADTCIRSLLASRRIRQQCKGKDFLITSKSLPENYSANSLLTLWTVLMLTSQSFAVSRMDLPFLRDRMT